MSNQHSKLLLAVLAGLVAIGPFTMDAYLPSIPTIASEFGVSIAAVNLTVSSYFIGVSMGQLLGGPTSDQLGRSITVFIGLIAYFLATVGILFSDSIGQVQFFRVLQGLAGGFSSVGAIPIVRDIYEPREAARKIPIVLATMMIAPLTAPLIGTVLVDFGWHSVFIFLAIYGLTLLLLFKLFVDPLVPVKEGPRKLSLSGTINNFKRVFSHRIDNQLMGFKFILVQAFNGGVVFTFITNVAWLYMDYYDQDKIGFLIGLATPVSSILIINLLSSRYSNRLNLLKTIHIGQVLQFSLIAVLTLYCLFIGRPSFAMTVAALTLTFMMNAVCWQSNNALLFGMFKRLTGSVMSLNAFLGFTMGAILGSFTSLIFDNTMFPMLYTMGFASIISMSISFRLPLITLGDIEDKKLSEGY